MALEWTETREPNEDCRYDHTSAKTPFGEYLISWKSWKDYPNYSVEFQDEFVTAGHDLADAKMQAQADFDKRLSAALTSANNDVRQLFHATHTHSSTPKLSP